MLAVHEPRNFDAVEKCKGKTIKSLTLNSGSTIDFEFTDGTKMYIADVASYCCEYRYTTTDDDLTKAGNETFLGVETREGSGESKYEESHDIVFLYINTDKFTYVFETHNEHNGYYGGFELVANILD